MVSSRIWVRKSALDPQLLAAEHLLQLAANGQKHQGEIHAGQEGEHGDDPHDIIANIIAEADRMVEMMGDVKNKIHEQQKKLDDTMDKSGAVALGVNNSLRDIDTIRNKISVLSQSGDSIQDIVTNLASIAEQNESSTQATMDSALGMSDTMNSLENASESLKDMARALDESLVRFKM